METVFTKLMNREIPVYVIYEDEDTFAFLDLNAYTPGHTLVITKKYYRTYVDVPNDLQAKLAATITKVTEILKQATGKPDCTILTRVGPSAGQEIPHVHLHIVPSSPDDPITFGHNHITYDREKFAKECQKYN